MKRRDLIQKIVIGGATILVVPSVLSSCEKDPGTNGTNGTTPKKLTIDMSNASYSTLKNAGGFVVVQGIIVANTGSGYVALNSECTHNGCTIGYDPVAKNFPCPCHGSIYSTTGSVINGPAVVAVKSYSLSVSGDVITITL